MTGTFLCHIIPTYIVDAKQLLYVKGYNKATITLRPLVLFNIHIFKVTPLVLFNIHMLGIIVSGFVDAEHFRPPKNKIFSF